MTIEFRPYHAPEDTHLVGTFLIEQYKPGNRDGNWLQPAWEYMHTHPCLDKTSLGKIGIWEEAGRILAVAHYESAPGEAFFQIRDGYGRLKPELLDYAEGHLYGTSPNGEKVMQVFVDDFDEEFVSLVERRGYIRRAGQDRPLSQFIIPKPLPAIELPAGYRLKSLAEDCDWVKIHRVLWRGFNHSGEPPADELEERKHMQDSPNFRHDLKIVVEAPVGDFVAFCGMWYEPINRYAYVEPVATDPDFRRMGLGRAAVMEGIRRCEKLGARVAYVGADIPFYQATGFARVFTSECWEKKWRSDG